MNLRKGLLEPAVVVVGMIVVILSFQNCSKVNWNSDIKVTQGGD